MLGFVNKLFISFQLIVFLDHILLFAELTQNFKFGAQSKFSHLTEKTWTDFRVFVDGLESVDGFRDPYTDPGTVVPGSGYGRTGFGYGVSVPGTAVAGRDELPALGCGRRVQSEQP